MKIQRETVRTITFVDNIAMLLQRLYSGVRDPEKVQKIVLN